MPIDESLFTMSDNTPEYIDLLSLHEAGHAIVGSMLGFRIEAVYSTYKRLPSGSFHVYPFCRIGPQSKNNMTLKDQVLLTAGGPAAELMINGTWDPDNAKVDRAQLEEIGIWNFEYCVNAALNRVRANETLLIAIRRRIKFSMDNLKQCKLTRGGTHIILAAGSEIEKLSRTLGCPVDSESLNLETARHRD